MKMKMKSSIVPFPLHSQFMSRLRCNDSYSWTVKVKMITVYGMPYSLVVIYQSSESTWTLRREVDSSYFAQKTDSCPPNYTAAHPSNIINNSDFTLKLKFIDMLK
jgi:hypothetical protein